jgi:hypothetical protein
MSVICEAILASGKNYGNVCGKSANAQKVVDGVVKHVCGFHKEKAPRSPSKKTATPKGVTPKDPSKDLSPKGASPKGASPKTVILLPAEFPTLSMDGTNPQFASPLVKPVVTPLSRTGNKRGPKDEPKTEQKEVDLKVTPPPGVFAKENTCQAKNAKGKNEGGACTKPASFFFQDRLLCGTHKGKHNAYVKLPENPDAKSNKEAMIASHDATVELMMQENRKNGLRGKIMVTRMVVNESVKLTSGYKGVFPDMKSHPNGLTVKTLNPGNVGPIKNNQDDIISLNLENYFQSGMMYSSEQEKDGSVSDKFLDRLDAGRQMKKPHAHKYDMFEEWKGLKNDVVVKWVRETSADLITYSEVEARYFYCSIYENHVKSLPEFLALEKFLEDGYNLQICGFTGSSLPDGEIKDVLYTLYTDDKKPFRHELALCAMLTLSEDEYPWNKFHMEHPEVYAEDEDVSQEGLEEVVDEEVVDEEVVDEEVVDEEVVDEEVVDEEVVQDEKTEEIEAY